LVVIKKVVNNKAAINQAAVVLLAVSLSHSKTYLAEDSK
jgi:predicted dinucleotide-binding enzyme